MLQAAFANREKIPSAIDLHRELNALKNTELSWMYRVSKCAPQEEPRNGELLQDHAFGFQMRNDGTLIHGPV